MSGHLYLLITLSSSILSITVVSVIAGDIIWTCRQRVQAERLLSKAKEHFIENRMQERPYSDELTVLYDLVICHELSRYWRKTANKKNGSQALSN
jgi:hypothetical protein